MRKAWTVAALALTLMLAPACSGGASKSGTPAGASPTAAPAATSAPSAVPVPAKPASFSDYASTIAGYLSASPNADRDCLAALYAAWAMPLISAKDGCRLANTDADPDNELVAVLTARLATPTATADTQFEITVFDPASGAYRLAYESAPYDVVPPGHTEPIAPILAAGALTGDSTGKLAYRTDGCIGALCVATVHIIAGTTDGYVAVAPADGIPMPGATDVHIDDAKQFVLTGAEPETPATGPQRGRTETWAWDGSAYALKTTTPAAPRYLYHAILDADALLQLGDYAGAQAAYAAAIDARSLALWKPDKNERAELEAYALFHAALASLLAGGDRDSATALLDRSKAYANTLNAQLAGSFEAGYAAKQSISVGCGAASDDLLRNGAEYASFWNYGTANPRFDPATVCPY
jgi:hypothetical protein